MVGLSLVLWGRLFDAHNALADIYRRSPFVTVRSEATEALWREVEELERALSASEGVEF